MTKQYRCAQPVGLIRALFVFLCAGFISQANAETITVGGTGAGLGTMQLLGQAFGKAYPEHFVKVLPSLGTSGGIKALQNHALDIAVSARGATPEEKAKGLVTARYGITALVFASYPKAPALALTKQKIADIYSGRQASWPDSTPIRPILRPRNDTDTSLVKAISPEIEAAVESAHQKRGMLIAVTDTDASNLLEKTPGAFGTSTLALLLAEKREVKILPVDGIKPSVKTISNGTYPYRKEMYILTSTNPSRGAKQFLEFIHSAKGTAILKKIGHKVD